MGSLRQTPLPRLLFGLARDRFGGVLELDCGGARRRFQWRAGAPVGLVSEVAGETLCDALVRRGALRADDVARVRGRAKQAGTSGELAALAAGRFAAPKTLLLALAELIRSALVACFRGNDGRFEMQPALGGDAAPALPLDLVEVCWSGIVAHWRPEHVLEAFADRLNAYPAPGPGFPAARAALPPSRALEALCARLDGRSTVYAALQSAPSLEAYAALYVLDLQQALVFAAEPLADGGAREERPPEIEIVVAGGDAGASDAALRPEASARAPEIEDASARALREQILSLHAHLRDLDLYQVLGLERGASAAEVRRAYLQAAKRMHPDRVVKLGLEELKEQANEVFAEVTRAHAILSNAEERQRYDDGLAGHDEATAQRVAQAEAFFRKGELLLRSGSFRAAAELLEKAVAVWPDEADYQAALGWALHRMNPPDNARARAALQHANALRADHAQTLLRLSYVEKELGQAAEAQQLAARARKLDPAVTP